jgi:hypothetical protein
LEKLPPYFASVSDTPQGLQQKVFFDVMLYLCRRGRENLTELKKTDFSVMKDPSGAKYVTQTRDELTKNHRDDDDAFGGHMYETKGIVL